MPPHIAGNPGLMQGLAKQPLSTEKWPQVAFWYRTSLQKVSNFQQKPNQLKLFSGKPTLPRFRKVRSSSFSSLKDTSKESLGFQTPNGLDVWRPTPKTYRNNHLWWGGRRWSWPLWIVEDKLLIPIILLPLGRFPMDRFMHFMWCESLGENWISNWIPQGGPLPVIRGVIPINGYKWPYK